MENESKVIAETLENLCIENPCPMILARMQGQENGNLYCKSCHKNLVDFTSCSNKEIAERLALEKNICAVFYQDQLAGQHKVHYTFWQKLVFHLLVIFAFIGFSVKPLQAQKSKKNKKETETIEEATNTVMGLAPVKSVTFVGKIVKIEDPLGDEFQTLRVGWVEPKPKKTQKRRRGKKKRWYGTPSW